MTDTTPIGGAGARATSVRGALALFVAAWASLPACARADGGALRIRDATPHVTVSVFTAPEPLRVGPADVSVLVQRPDGGVVLDARVDVTAAPPDGADAAREPAMRSAATSKLLYAAPLTLAAAGAWGIAVTVTTPDGRTTTVRTVVQVAAASPPLRAVWPWLVLPPIAVVAFALHQGLRAREAAHVRQLLGSLRSGGTAVS